MTSPFLESSWKIKLGSKGQAVSSVSGFWVIVINLGEGPNYSSNSEDLSSSYYYYYYYFSTDFSRTYFSYSLAFIATKIHRNVGTIATWVAMTFVTLDMIESELFPKNKILQKNTTLRQYLLFFKSFFFILFTCPRQSPWSTSVTTYQSSSLKNGDW